MVPPTVIVVHQKERRSKCTVESLRDRPGFSFLNYPLTTIPDLAGYVRLAVGAPLLGPVDAGRGLLILDATWRLAELMAPTFASVPARGIPNWKTAYPRISKLQKDPDEGLATIEAIYVAYRLLGRDTSGLLDGYRWSREFLELNREELRVLG